MSQTRGVKKVFRTTSSAGNSGSPGNNRKGEIVGLALDDNIHFLGKRRGGRTTKSHIIVTDDPEGQRLMGPIPKHLCSGKPLLTDYEGDHYCNRAQRYGNAMLRF